MSFRCTTEKFMNCFEKCVEDSSWASDPFGVPPTLLPFKAQEELMDLTVDRTLKLKFCDLSLETFWLLLKEEYSVISKMAVRVLLLFSTVYLC
jgi:hypothetical protein